MRKYRVNGAFVYILPKRVSFVNSIFVVILNTFFIFGFFDSVGYFRITFCLVVLVNIVLLNVFYCLNEDSKSITKDNLVLVRFHKDHFELRLCASLCMS